MTRSRNLRLYRACQRCRQRKLKCDPTTSPGSSKASCSECLRSGAECLPTGSRRGGNFAHARRSRQSNRDSTPSPGYQTSQGDMAGKPLDDPLYAELKNPGDALQILARLASNDVERPIGQGNPTWLKTQPVNAPRNGELRNDSTATGNGTLPGTQPSPFQPVLSETETLVIGVLGTDMTNTLIKRYAENFHPFCPLVSPNVFKTANVQEVAVAEPFLLIVIVTIASKDDPNFSEIHQQCWKYLKRHLLDVLLAAPVTLNVGTVEGLLLLSEWVPYFQWGTTSYPTLFSRNLSAVEDNMAWSLIGQAVRHSYLLGLDRASFREQVQGESVELENRRRLAWIFVYIADRQISVRMGQSFWSRGPSLSTHFTVNDFPSLRLGDDAQHKYADVLQATIELTQLLHNSHDILYSSKRRTMQMIRLGDYNRYLDDFRQSLLSWQDRWGQLKASPKLQSTLGIVKEYVSLYVNAFSFQSILSRALESIQTARSTWPSSPGGAPSLFPQGIMASADGAYVFEAIYSAKRILTIASETDAVAHIRFMPFRFYVYTIYSAVFLYKAYVFGAFLRSEHDDITDLVRRFTLVLDNAATNDGHVGWRYSSLLKRIWSLGEASLGQADLNYSETQDNQRCSPSSVTNVSTGLNALACPEIQLPVGVLAPTPDFNLFCPDFSNLESELFNLGANEDFGFPPWPVSEALS